MFNTIEERCKACVPFIKRIQELPDHANLVITVSSQFIVDIPEQIKVKLEDIRGISDELLGPTYSDDSWESDQYFNQINLNIVQQMKRRGHNLVNQRFQQIYSRFQRKEPFIIRDHVIYLRQAISYIAFCSEAVSVLANMTPDNANSENNAIDESVMPSHLSTSTLYNANEPVMGMV